MSQVVQARIDDKTAALLEELKSQFGWTDSEIVRQGIRALRDVVVKKQKRQIAGLGEFDSGIPDLGSNKDHLEGFGS